MFPNQKPFGLLIFFRYLPLSFIPYNIQFVYNIFPPYQIYKIEFYDNFQFEPLYQERPWGGNTIAKALTEKIFINVIILANHGRLLTAQKLNLL